MSKLTSFLRELGSLYFPKKNVDFQFSKFVLYVNLDICSIFSQNDMKVQSLKSVNYRGENIIFSKNHKSK